MLDSLLIKNYRILKELKIDTLARINLITGKNNTGKSTVLEAIAIYAGKGDLKFILQLLNNNGEYFEKEINVRSLSSMFHDRIITFDPQNAIVTGSTDNKKYIQLQYVKYVDEYQKSGHENIIGKKILPADSKIENYKTGFNVRVDSSSSQLFLDEKFRAVFGYRNLFVPDKFQFIRTWNIDTNTAGKLFDDIILTDKEKYIIEALKIIEPRTERIAFVQEEHSRQRSAVVKLTNTTKALPLKSMGDGINRILSIILAVVNAENGFLLIDEFENGLHYSVQEQLWKMIFKLSQMLNIQVFVTTHSNDCIYGFESALNSPENTVDGKLIRLENINGCIKHVEYPPDELKIANKQQIETR
ncbi:MAG: AAA family ATPase [Dysgonamonadaceae bacterium]|jgi:AAA15 family ATPase/GTPase|nr:AAA family ATPase [Dysgonamonadaceae bacterium]